MNILPPSQEVLEIESVPARMVWTHEAQAFTPWLAANLGRLSEAIGAPLRLVDMKAVGETRIVDLLARDERDGSLVVIENQLEPADDAHLGQILSYVAATNARAAVWLATRFDEPQLSAVRWLKTAALTLAFYAVEIQVVRIGGSAPAVIFDVLERPNRWVPFQSSITAAAPIFLGGFATAFWAAHLKRYPDEDQFSRPVGERCRWRSTCLKSVVIGQILQEDGARVFLRGRNGVPLETAAEALAPFAQRLEQRLGVAFRDEKRPALAETKLAMSVVNPVNWNALSDWMRTQSDVVDSTLQEGTRKTRPSLMAQARPYA